jgi:MFS family permease
MRSQQRSGGGGLLRMSKTFASLKHPDFRLLWITSVMNSGSNWLQQVTLGWLAYDISGSAVAAGLTFGIRSLPSLLISPIGGVIGDRFERKRGLQINSAYMAVLALGFALLLAMGEVEVWHILLFTLLQGLGQALVQPVRQALVANTVPQEDLMNAIALNSFAFSTMRVIGPAVAGVLIVFFGPATNFGIQSLAYVLILLLIVPMKSPYDSRIGRRRTESFGSDFVAGLRYVTRQPTVFALILLALAPAFFTTPIQLGLLPVFARESLKVGSDGLGLLYAMQGVGAVISTLTIASLGNFKHKGLVLSVAILCQAFAVICYSQITWLLLALPFLTLATGSWTTFNTLNQTILQTVTPDEYRARVMGVRMMDNGLTPLGSLVFGVVADVYGVSTAILIAGICGMAIALFIIVRFPAIRNFRTGAPEEAIVSAPERASGTAPAAATRD